LKQQKKGDLKMKKLTLTAAMALFCGVLFGGENLVKNGEFNSKSNWNPSWSKVKGTIEIDTTTFKSAPSSMKVVSTAKNQYTFCRQSVTVKPNTEYIFSVNMKTENVEGNGACYWVLKANGKTLRDGSTAGLWKGDTGTIDWTPVMISFKTKESTKLTLMFGFKPATTGTVWFDDVKLVEKQ
jgi:hypothetical protein